MGLSPCSGHSPGAEAPMLCHSPRDPPDSHPPPLYALWGFLVICLTQLGNMW
ncbi:hypothetical protein NT01EI_0217 [Edwardsiella ictaluri 93-146]|uniref:Uncharacterized protein n=1 Tax=Edwardsiella ictaluri (strain 93-146) TaxID=634503 RepID=C5B6Z8_EDWI9|nr:hypothetical protein NT01EI_0217 [Edwardsiella ictaluri 93-146]